MSASKPCASALTPCASAQLESNDKESTSSNTKEKQEDRVSKISQLVINELNIHVTKEKLPEWADIIERSAKKSGNLKMEADAIFLRILSSEGKERKDYITAAFTKYSESIDSESQVDSDYKDTMLRRASVLNDLADRSEKEDKVELLRGSFNILKLLLKVDRLNQSALDLLFTVKEKLLRP
ncbi:MAG: hypothetical protein WAM28_07670 [Chlamydiales bacterium]